MTEIQANNKNELTEILSKMDIRVPARTEGRETVHCETWSICHLMATLATHEKLIFPLELMKTERPDYILKMGPKFIGIEITELTNSDYARATTLPEHFVEGTVIDPSLFKWNSRKRSLNNLRKIALKKELTGPGWESDSVEIEYANAVHDVVIGKTKKLNSDGFKKLSDNYLLIYCNLTLPFLDVDKSNRFMVDKLNNYWGKNSFSSIYVEKDDIFIHYSIESTECMKLKNLWSNG